MKCFYLPPAPLRFSSSDPSSSEESLSFLTSNALSGFGTSEYLLWDFWDFEVAEVKKPILGADFLTAHSLVVDLQWGCLTSNEDRHLMLPCDLHVFSSSRDYAINRIHRLLEEEL